MAFGENREVQEECVEMCVQAERDNLLVVSMVKMSEHMVQPGHDATHGVLKRPGERVTWNTQQ